VVVPDECSNLGVGTKNRRPFSPRDCAPVLQPPYDTGAKAAHLFPLAGRPKWKCSRSALGESANCMGPLQQCRPESRRSITYVDTLVTGKMRLAAAIGVTMEPMPAVGGVVYTSHTNMRKAPLGEGALIHLQGSRLGSAVDNWLLSVYRGPYFMRDPRIHNLS